MKAAIIACMLLMLPLALACKESYNINEEVMVNDVIESAGEDADCNITLYKNNTLVATGDMAQHGLAYNYQFGKISKGAYVANIECNKTINATSEALFLSECKFDVGPGGDSMIIALIFVPLVLGAFMLFSAWSLDGEAHPALKLSLFLIAFITPWVSFHFAMIGLVENYEIPALQNLVGSTTYWLGMVFFALLGYFLIYLFSRIVHHANMNKRERLEY